MTNHKKWMLNRLFLLVGLLVGSTLQAGQHQSHSSIQNAAEEHVLSALDDTTGITATPGRLDNRLRLEQCDQELESFIPYGRKNNAKVTVGIRCNGSVRWTLYVPVSLSIEKSVLVASRELPRGTILTATDFKTELRDVARLHRGYLTKEQHVIGKKLKRTVHSDNILTPAQLTIQHAVKKGSQVIILANIGSLQVRMRGKALGNGSVGERIKVENSSSNRRIEVTVISPGVVEAAT